MLLVHGLVDWLCWLLERLLDVGHLGMRHWSVWLGELIVNRRLDIYIHWLLVHCCCLKSVYFSDSYAPFDEETDNNCWYDDAKHNAAVTFVFYKNLTSYFMFWCIHIDLLPVVSLWLPFVVLLMLVVSLAFVSILNNCGLFGFFVFVCNFTFFFSCRHLDFDLDRSHRGVRLWRRDNLSLSLLFNNFYWMLLLFSLLHLLNLLSLISLFLNLVNFE